MGWKKNVRYIWKHKGSMVYVGDKWYNAATVRLSNADLVPL